jgi:DNA-binding beta-propeller fold protein YncE
VDGQGEQASLGAVTSMTLDGNGNLYFFSASVSARVRKVELATGTVTTLLGGIPLQRVSSLLFRRELASGSPQDELFVADWDGRVRRMFVPQALFDSEVVQLPQACISLSLAASDPYDVLLGCGSVVARDHNGQASVLAGAFDQHGSQNGNSTAARLSAPSTLVSCGDGAVFVLDSGNRAVRKLDLSTGAVTAAMASGSIFASGLACDASGNLFVTDSSEGVVWEVDATTGQPSLFAGLLGERVLRDGVGMAARFRAPGSLALDGRQTLYVFDDDRVRTIDLTTGMVATPDWASLAPGSLDVGESLAVDGSGRPLLALDGHESILRLDPPSSAWTVAARLPVASTGILLVDRCGRAFSGLTDGTVAQVDLDGGETLPFVGAHGRRAVLPGTLPGSLNWPSGLALSPAGDLLIADTSENVILVVH